VTRGVLGSGYKPDLDTSIRLGRWHRMASDGVPVNDIAKALGMSRVALQQMVCRARRRGDPAAVRHPYAGSPPGQGTAHLRDSSERARRIRQHTDRTTSKEEAA
jgi:hypothetical protein